MNAHSIVLRLGDLVRSFGRPPYRTLPELLNPRYSLRRTIDVSAEMLAVPGTSTRLYVFINDRRVNFTVDAKGRKHLPHVLRRRL